MSIAPEHVLIRSLCRGCGGVIYSTTAKPDYWWHAGKPQDHVARPMP